MKVKDWLTSATKQLEAVGIGSARLDCLILLEDELGKDRSYILAHPELKIENIKKLDAKILKRSKHEPLAYIRGFSEFYGRKFMVNKNVLEPRPESEAIIELLKSLKLSSPVIADIGTGSGALAITAKLEIPTSQVLAVDIDKKCLEVARKNVKELKADITLERGDLLEPLSAADHNPSIVLANLPYVPDSYRINEAAAMEPRLAIFGGPDGLDLYRKMFAQINTLKSKPKYILTESLPPQHKKLAKIAANSGYRQKSEADFIQLFYH